uniref:HAD family hydrolase n=1 Tax=Fervidicoccus fontis TaxID=683846 RepID=A0A7J3ZL33_9CREN
MKCNCIVVFDFDGVIVEKENESIVRTKTVRLLKSYTTMGCKVTILSGRRSSDRRKVLNTLWDYGVHPRELFKVILRPPAEHVAEKIELEWKAKQLASLTSSRRNLQVCELHEDNIEVLEWASRNIPEACLVLHQQGEVLVVYKRTRNCIIQETGIDTYGGRYYLEERHTA